MESGRLFRDEAGIEWEVYDESAWSVSLAIEWDYLPQHEHPGLIFESAAGVRRLYPCPPDWRSLDDAGMARLCESAARLG